ncbi:hypothetical protein JCM33374_g6183 [Metschnikowia sp. JCM 33374]|nr:hypothetical protein JCM33374_g6183 [Metschnikowia sp. JCM 33374]
MAAATIRGGGNGMDAIELVRRGRFQGFGLIAKGRLSTLGVDVYRREDNDTQRVQRALEGYFSKLKSFLNETSFDVGRFECSRDSLKEELLVVSSSVKNAPSSENFSNQLTFIRRMFYVMANAIDPLKQFNKSGTQQHVWLYKIIELNVRLFGVQTSQGRLDVKLAGFQDKLLRFHHSVYFWSLRYKDLADLPEHMRLLFKSEADQAQKIIDSLMSQVPEPTHLMT